MSLGFYPTDLKYLIFNFHDYDKTKDVENINKLFDHIDSNYKSESQKFFINYNRIYLRILKYTNNANCVIPKKFYEKIACILREKGARTRNELKCPLWVVGILRNDLEYFKNNFDDKKRQFRGYNPLHFAIKYSSKDLTIINYILDNYPKFREKYRHFNILELAKNRENYKKYYNSPYMDCVIEEYESLTPLIIKRLK